MNQNTRLFIALAITILVGVGYSIFGEDNRGTYAVIAGPIVALTWIGFSLLGRGETTNSRRDQN